jgi:hypothetical protein
MMRIKLLVRHTVIKGSGYPKVVMHISQFDGFANSKEARKGDNYSTSIKKIKNQVHRTLMKIFESRI